MIDETEIDVSQEKRLGITISVVSHGHGRMIVPLVATLLRFPEVEQIIVTHNIPEDVSLPESPIVSRVYNESPRGFGANHNAAFARCAGDFFCVLNPDIRLPENPFPELLFMLIECDAAMIAPRVVTDEGVTEDSARHFPTIGGIVKKIMGVDDGRHAELCSENAFYPECVAGMFMLFRKAAFEKLGGFDQRFFLYYEDMDICVRIWKSGMRIVLLTSTAVVHNAQRASHKSFTFLTWHVFSMLRFFALHTGRLPKLPQSSGTRDCRAMP